MAQMPRGQSRPVPDPAGELYDKAMLDERRRREAGDSALTHAIRSQSPLSVARRFDFRPAWPLRGTVSVNGREIDAACVVQPRLPLASPAQLEAQKQAINRAFYMAGNPIAASAYGIASVVSPSQTVRDRALIAGGVADAVMLGAAPRGSSYRGRVQPPRHETAGPGLERPPIRPKEPNTQGQAQRVDATITKSMLGTGTRPNPRLTPPGWLGDGDLYNQSRGHLLASQLGGTGRKMWNLVTLTQDPANSPNMLGFENNIARRVRSGEVVEYSVMPIYNDGISAPSAVFMTAYGTRGDPVARVVQNPAGRRP